MTCFTHFTATEYFDRLLRSRWGYRLPLKAEERNVMFAYENQFEKDFQDFLNELYKGNRIKAEAIRRIHFSDPSCSEPWFNRRVQNEIINLGSLMTPGTFRLPH